MDFLDKIRVPQKSNYIKRQVIVTIGILLFWNLHGIVF